MVLKPWWKWYTISKVNKCSRQYLINFQVSYKVVALKPKAIFCMFPYLYDFKLLLFLFFLSKLRGSKAYKTPLKFLTVKLLWQIQISWKHWNSWRKMFVGCDPVDTGRKLNVHNTFNLGPVSTGEYRSEDK